MREPRIGWEEARALRLERHHLHRRAPRGSEVQVAGEICGLHAQLLSSAALSLWARVEGASLESFERALWRERKLVKTWAMRGTLHLLPARDLPVYFGALSTCTHYLKQGWVRYFGVTREQIELVIETVGEVLRGGALTREQLADAVAGRTGSKKLGAVLRQSWGVLLKPAAYRGKLCFAASEGARVRFTHPGPLRELDPRKALAELARRYLRAYGPATRDDFALWWGGTSLAQAQRLLESLDASAVDLEGRRAWVDGEPRSPGGARSVRLLPAFDPYIVGAPRSGGLFPPAHRRRLYRPQGWISPALLVDGHVEGVWKHERKNGRLAVRIDPFTRLPARVRAEAAEEAERLAAYFGVRLERVEIG
ncbi:MAG TPA: winged helix DNA-binding domain-containing protein [Myxococcales bacterium]